MRKTTIAPNPIGAANPYVLGHSKSKTAAITGALRGARHSDSVSVARAQPAAGLSALKLSGCAVCTVGASAKRCTAIMARHWT
jgi:hypothetical protein